MFSRFGAVANGELVLVAQMADALTAARPRFADEVAQVFTADGKQVATADSQRGVARRYQIFAPLTVT